MKIPILTKNEADTVRRKFRAVATTEKISGDLALIGGWQDLAAFYRDADGGVWIFQQLAGYGSDGFRHGADTLREFCEGFDKGPGRRGGLFEQAAYEAGAVPASVTFRGYLTDAGESGLEGAVYASQSLQGGARVVGCGTLQHPFAVKLTPAQEAAPQTLLALHATRKALRAAMDRLESARLQAHCLEFTSALEQSRIAIEAAEGHAGK